ncbi:MAG: hypothetical protein JW827_11490, partial [Spirochaetes bacterium]|nr:hypothetical protein [Spirochaetota bacterium]
NFQDKVSLEIVKRFPGLNLGNFFSKNFSRLEILSLRNSENFQGFVPEIPQEFQGVGFLRRSNPNGWFGFEQIVYRSII